MRPGEMRAALEFTAAETGFSQRIIEKDYWCSLVLRELAEKRVALFRSGIEADLLPMLRATAGAPFDFNDAMQDLQRLHALVTMT